MENFDLRAKDYDTDKRLKRAKAVADEIREHIVDGHRKSAIEYGCGTGLVGIQLVHEFKTLLFVDSSMGMIERVNQKLNELKNPAASALCCDFMNHIPQGLQADYIFSSLVLHHIKDTEKILKRLHNALCSGGHLLIVDVDKEDGSFHAKYPDFDGHNGFDQDFLAKLAVNTGFAEVKSQTFYHGSKTVDERDAAYSLFILDAKK